LDINEFSAVKYSYKGRNSPERQKKTQRKNRKRDQR
jgi:hypothetical protein